MVYNTYNTNAIYNIQYQTLAQHIMYLLKYISRFTFVKIKIGQAVERLCGDGKNAFRNSPFISHAASTLIRFS